MIEEKLKNCPFCGAMPLRVEKVIRLSPVNWKLIRCSKCGAETDGKLTMKEAEEAWNKRVN